MFALVGGACTKRGLVAFRGFVGLSGFSVGVGFVRCGFFEAIFAGMEVSFRLSLRRAERASLDARRRQRKNGNSRARRSEARTNPERRAAKEERSAGEGISDALATTWTARFRPRLRSKRGLDRSK